MKIVVTGGAGFIGSNLCRELIGRGVDDVTVIDDLSTGFSRNLAGVDVTFHEASLLNRAALNDAMAGVDSVVHLAAIPSVPRSLQEPEASHHVNATGTLAVLEVARREGASVIVASSSSVYGANPTLPKSEALLPMPMSPYAVSKLATEQYALAYQESFRLRTLAFRFFNVFGPGQAAGHSYAAVVPAFLQSALSGEALVVHGDGHQTRDFTFVATVVRVLADAALKQVSHNTPVNLAFGTRTSLLDLIRMIEVILGKSLEVEHVPPRVGDVRDSQASSDSLMSLFPDVRQTSLEDGLTQTINWLDESHRLGRR